MNNNFLKLFFSKLYFANQHRHASFYIKLITLYTHVRVYLNMIIYIIYYILLVCYIYHIRVYLNYCIKQLEKSII